MLSLHLLREHADMLNHLNAVRAMWMGLALGLVLLLSQNFAAPATMKCINGVQTIDGRKSMDADSMPKTCHVGGASQSQGGQWFTEHRTAQVAARSVYDIE